MADRQQVLQGVEGFNRDKLKYAKVKETAVLPKKEQIQHERQEQKLRPVETREPASPQQVARQELSRSQADSLLSSNTLLIQSPRKVPESMGPGITSNTSVPLPLKP